MAADLINLAIPVFVAMVLLEAWWGHRSKKKIYRFGDTLANLGCGLLSQVVGIGFALIAFVPYEVLYSNFSPWQFSGNSPWHWFAAIIGVDFCYYWLHRFNHLFNIGWASHVVHHQSEEYNLSVALRQSAFGTLTSWPFYLPLAFLGIPTWLTITSLSINLLYQFWIHTRLINRMGFCELVLNTPSHHRVHHGINRPYLDHNFGGIFIIWDRIFGSFVREREVVRYGVLKPLHSWNPLRANIEPWHDLIKQSFALRGSNKFRLWFKNPGWQPGDRGVADAVNRVDYAALQTFNPPLTHRQKLKIFMFFAAGFIVGFLFLFP